jgi:hypothetical protein
LAIRKTLVRSVSLDFIASLISEAIRTVSFMMEENIELA